jgi:ABC-2 type transport system permease protein
MAGIKDIIRFEVPRALKKKSFWYTTLIPPLIILIVAAIEFSSIKSTQNNNQTENLAKTSKIAILDESGLINEKGLTSLNIKTEPTKEAGIDAVKNDRLDAFFYYPADVSKDGISIYAQDKGIALTSPYNTEATDLLSLNVLSKVAAETHDPQISKILVSSPSTSDVTYKNGKKTNSLANLIAPGIFLFAFLIVIVLSSYLMLTSTTEEKENRVAEIILTSIKSRSLIIGKMISILILGAIQLLVILGSLLVVYKFFKHITLPGGVTLSHIPINPLAITYGVLFFIGGLALFTGILVGFSALFPSAQQAGRYLGVVIIWTFLPIYAISSIISSTNTTLVKVFTYFPLTAPTTSLIRNAVGNLSTQEALITLVITYVSATLAIAFAIRAFQYGAMEYGRRISIKEILRSRK